MPGQGRHERLVRAYRALFFARIALGKGRLPFSLSRLAEALSRFRAVDDPDRGAAASCAGRGLDWRDVRDGA